VTNGNRCAGEDDYDGDDNLEAKLHDKV